MRASLAGASDLGAKLRRINEGKGIARDKASEFFLQAELAAGEVYRSNPDRAALLAGRSAAIEGGAFRALLPAGTLDAAAQNLTVELSLDSPNDPNPTPFYAFDGLRREGRSGSFI